VDDALAHPLRALYVAWRGPATEGPFAPDPADRLPQAELHG
jgi:hypothetical protein